MKSFISLILLVSNLFISSQVQAENMLMLRVNESYDNTMITVKQKLTEYGYTIAHIQKCDGGLESMGYKSDDYKVIFFGKISEMKQLTSKHPEIIPFVPLKLAVIKEKDSVVLVAVNPVSLSVFFSDKELQTQFKRWESDLRSIYSEISHKKYAEQ